MDKKELGKLSRKELLELMLSQSKEIDRLKEEIASLKEASRSREMLIKRAGTMAEASLLLSGVFEAADLAAKDYLENLKQMEGDVELRRQAILEDARVEANRIIQKAVEEGAIIRRDTESYIAERTKEYEEYCVRIKEMVAKIKQLGIVDE